MDTPQPLKRRKLNGAVHKPFKSPMRTPLRPNTNPPAPSPLATAPVQHSTDQNVSTDSPSILRETPSKCVSHSKFSHKTASKPDPNTPSDPATVQEIQTISRALRTTDTSIMNARHDIDILQQAVGLLTSSKDSELEALSLKWRAASRLAAEEVFASARDRVNRMGGVGAMREREREQKEFQAGWDELPQKCGSEDGEEVDEREERFEEEWDYDRETREAKEKDAGRDDDSFTMDMMLKMMSIDLHLIGYDKQRQRWTE